MQYTISIIYNHLGPYRPTLRPSIPGALQSYNHSLGGSTS